LKHFLAESLKTGLFQKEQLKNLSNRLILIPCRKIKSLKISPKKGRHRGVSVLPRASDSSKKPNQKSNKTLLTAKKLNKTTHTLLKTSILLKKPTAKPC